ncbi:MAG: hypothetical protein H6752_12560 [Candidatus Omnitrophica bacterium]|nr:hypothetical protein [Candidatus Omnitrophota bacterium]
MVENKNGEEAYIIWHAEGADLERLPETDWDSRRIEIVSERMSLPRNFSSEAERRRERGFEFD